MNAMNTHIQKDLQNASFKEEEEKVIWQLFSSDSSERRLKHAASSKYM